MWKVFFEELAAKFGPKVATLAEKYLSKTAMKEAGAKYGKAAGSKLDKFITASENRVGTWAAGSQKATLLRPGPPATLVDYQSPWMAKTTLGRAAQRTAWNQLYPTTKGRAFSSAFIRGAGRSTGSSVFNLGVDALLGAPKALVKYPQTKTFISTFAREFQRVRGISNIKVGTLKQLKSAYGIASKEAARTSRVGRFLGPDSADFVRMLRRYERTGFISGRLSVAGANYYVFTTEEKRDQRVEKFKRTFTTNARKMKRTWVDPYIREGLQVRGYYRRVAA